MLRLSRDLCTFDSASSSTAGAGAGRERGSEAQTDLSGPWHTLAGNRTQPGSGVAGVPLYSNVFWDSELVYVLSTSPGTQIVNTNITEDRDGLGIASRTAA